MATLNQCNFIGNLGADPEVKYTPAGDAVASFSIACTEKWKDKNTGEGKERTEWIRIVAWRGLAEIAGKYLKKGAPVFVSGKLITRKWTDKDGVDRYTSEIVAETLQMLGQGQGNTNRPPHPAESNGDPATQAGGASGYDPKPENRTPRPPPSFDDLGDDLPF